MFCGNCGKEIKNDTHFCPYCGSAVQSRENQTASTAFTGTENAEERSFANIGSDGYFSEPDFHPGRQKKSGKKLILLAIPLLLIVVCALNFHHIYGAVLRMVSPKSYFQYIETKEFDKYADMASGYYESLILNNLKEDQSCSSEISFRLYDGILDFLKDSGYEGDDLELVNDLSLNVNYTVDDEKSSVEAGLKISNEDILSVLGTADFSSGKLFVSSPELTDQVIEAELSSNGSMNNLNLAGMPVEKLLAFQNVLPARNMLQKILSENSNVIIESIEDVTREKTSLSASGISQKCTELTATLSEREYYEMSISVLKSLRDDENIRSIIRAAQKNREELGIYDDSVDLYDEYVNSLDEKIGWTEESKESASSDDLISLICYVAGDEIIGQELESDGQVLFSYFTVRDGKEYATEFHSDLLDITGDGTETGGKRDGHYEITFRDEQSFDIALEDFDTKSAEKGYLNGTIRFENLPEEMGMYGSIPFGDSSTLSMMDPAYEFHYETSAKKRNMTLIILANDESFVGITVDTAFSGGKPIAVPQENLLAIDDDDEMQEFLESLNFDTVIDNLKKAGVSSELTDLLESFQEEYRDRLNRQDYDPYDNYDSYDYDFDDYDSYSDDYDSYSDNYDSYSDDSDFYDFDFSN